MGGKDEQAWALGAEEEQDSLRWSPSVHTSSPAPSSWAAPPVSPHSLPAQGMPTTSFPSRLSYMGTVPHPQRPNGLVGTGFDSFCLSLND